MTLGTGSLLLGAGDTGYNLTRSLRFRASASAYLNRTPSVSSSGTTYTWSGWVKRGKLGVAQGIFEADQPSGAVAFKFDAGDTLSFQLYYTPSGWNTIWATSAVFRDPSAWYHVILAVDTNQTLSVNRAKLYVNGVAQTFTPTDFGNPIPQGQSFGINQSGIAHRFGTYLNSNYLDGYITEVNYVVGQQLTQTSFGSTNGTTGVWQPKAYTGTYGTNGFYLDFEDTSSVAALGTDKSGNGNTWTVNNISLTAGVTYDSMTDVPTLTSETVANYAVWNPLFNPTNQSVTNGNLLFSNTSTISPILSSIGVSSGKYYAEFTWTSGVTNMNVGIANANLSKTNYVGSDTNGFGFLSSNGNLYYNGTGYAYGSAFPSNAIIMIAYDATNGKIWWGVNGTWVNSGNPATGANPGVAASGATINVTIPSDTWFFASGTTATSGCSANFGQQPFAYTPPTGFVALNTYNLPAGTVTTSGSFTGNVSSDGPSVYLNGVPTAMTINGNTVTFATHVDKTAYGFKLRTSSSSYNASGTNTYSVSTVGAVLKYANAQGNP